MDCRFENRMEHKAKSVKIFIGFRAIFEASGDGQNLGKSDLTAVSCDAVREAKLPA